MKLHWYVVVVMCICILGVGCRSNTPTTDAKEIKQVTQDPLVKTKDVTVKTTPSTLTTPTIRTAPVISEFPTLPEPGDTAIAKIADKEFLESEWLALRETFITRYLKDPKYIPGAIRLSIPPKIADYLEKGYGTVWNDNLGSVKEEEVILLQARLKDEKELEENLNNLGRGQEATRAAYTSAWFYCFQKKNDKAKAIAEKSELFDRIKDYGLAVPSEHIDKLKAELAKAPAIATPQPPKAIEKQATGTTTGDKQPVGTTTGDKQPEGATTTTGDKQPEGTTTTTGDKQPVGTTTGDKQPEGTTTGDKQPEGTTTGDKQPEGTTTGDKQPEGTTTGEKQPEGTGTEQEGMEDMPKEGSE